MSVRTFVDIYTPINKLSASHTHTHTLYGNLLAPGGSFLFRTLVVSVDANSVPLLKPLLIKSLHHMHTHYQLINATCHLEKIKLFETI